MKLEDFIPDYLGNAASVERNRPAVLYKKRQDIARELVPALGQRDMDDIAKIDIKRLIMLWHERGLSVKTINNYLCLLRNILRTACELEAASRVPAITPLKTLKQPPTKFLNRSELDAVWRSIRHEPAHWQFAVQLALLTGMRVGELRSIRRDHIREDVDGELFLWVAESTSGRFAAIGETKGRARAIPIGEPEMRIVEAFHCGTKFLIADTRGGRRDGAPLSYKAFQCAIHRIRDRAGIPWLTWHCFRHTYATQLRAMGVPMAHIQGLLGHVDGSTTARYAAPVNSEARAAVSGLHHRYPTLLKP